MPINLKDSSGVGFTPVSTANPLPVTIAGGGSASITTVGALNSGSITSGFGSIDVGADAISGGAISGTTLTGTGNTSVTPITGNRGVFVGADAESASIQTIAFGATPFLYGIRVNGTNASKTATISGNNLYAISGRGYQTVTGAFSSDVARILFQSTENFTDVANGSKVLIQATANGSTAIGTVAEFTSTGLAVTGTLGATGLLTVGGSTPASAAASGTAGTITWDASYIYVCTATNTWKRVAIATW